MQIDHYPATRICNSSSSSSVCHNKSGCQYLGNEERYQRSLVSKRQIIPKNAKQMQSVVLSAKRVPNGKCHQTGVVCETSPCCPANAYDMVCEILLVINISLNVRTTQLVFSRDIRKKTLRRLHLIWQLWDLCIGKLQLQDIKSGLSKPVLLNGQNKKHFE